MFFKTRVKTIKQLHNTLILNDKTCVKQTRNKNAIKSQFAYDTDLTDIFENVVAVVGYNIS